MGEQKINDLEMEVWSGAQQSKREISYSMKSTMLQHSNQAVPLSWRRHRVFLDNPQIPSEHSLPRASQTQLIFTASPKSSLYHSIFTLRLLLFIRFCFYWHCLWILFPPYSMEKSCFDNLYVLFFYLTLNVSARKCFYNFFSSNISLN